MVNQSRDTQRNTVFKGLSVTACCMNHWVWLQKIRNSSKPTLSTLWNWPRLTESSNQCHGSQTDSSSSVQACCTPEPPLPEENHGLINCLNCTKESNLSHLCGKYELIYQFFAILDYLVLWQRSTRRDNGNYRTIQTVCDITKIHLLK